MIPVFEDCRCGNREDCPSGYGHFASEIENQVSSGGLAEILLTVGVVPRNGRDRVPQDFRFEGFVSERSSSSSSESAIPAAAELAPLR